MTKNRYFWHISNILSSCSYVKIVVTYDDNRGTLLSSLSLVVNLICLVVRKVNYMSFSISIDEYAFFVGHYINYYCHLFFRFVNLIFVSFRNTYSAHLIRAFVRLVTLLMRRFFFFAYCPQCR